MTAEAAGTETTVRAAPFQSSAITLVGVVGKRSQAWTFQRFTADLHLKGAAPTGLDVVIETGSGATSDPALKARLEGRDALDIATHPQAAFHASELREVSRAGDVVTYAASGTLTLAGTSHPATLPVAISRGDGATVVRVTSSLDRAAWQRGFRHAPDGVFDDLLQLQARLVFPLVARP